MSIDSDAAAGTRQEPLVRLSGVKKHFPITQGILFQREIGRVHAVDGVTLTLAEGELVARSVVGGAARFSTGDRVFHQKFGPGTISAVDGNKLTVDFDKAGQKRVVDSFVEAV